MIRLRESGDLGFHLHLFGFTIDMQTAKFSVKGIFDGVLKIECICDINSAEDIGFQVACHFATEYKTFAIESGTPEFPETLSVSPSSEKSVLTLEIPVDSINTLPSEIQEYCEEVQKAKGDKEQLNKAEKELLKGNTIKNIFSKTTIFTCEDYFYKECEGNRFFKDIDSMPVDYVFSVYPEIFSLPFIQREKSAFRNTTYIKGFISYIIENKKVLQKLNDLLYEKFKPYIPHVELSEEEYDEGFDESVKHKRRLF